MFFSLVADRQLSLGEDRDLIAKTIDIDLNLFIASAFHEKEEKDCYMEGWGRASVTMQRTFHDRS